MNFCKQMMIAIVTFSFVYGSYCMEPVAPFNNSTQTHPNADDLKQKIAQCCKYNNIEYMDKIVEPCCWEHTCVQLYTLQDAITEICKKFDSAQIPYLKIDEILDLLATKKRTVQIQSIGNGKYIIVANTHARTVPACKNSNSKSTPTTITSISLNQIDSYFLTFAMANKWESIYDDSPLMINYNNNQSKITALQQHAISSCNECKQTFQYQPSGCAEHTYCENCLLFFMETVSDCNKCQEVNKSAFEPLKDNLKQSSNYGKQETYIPYTANTTQTTHTTNTTRSIHTLASNKSKQTLLQCSFCTEEFMPYESQIYFCTAHRICQSICPNCYLNIARAIDNCSSCQKKILSNPPSLSENWSFNNKKNSNVNNNYFNFNPENRRPTDEEIQRILDEDLTDFDEDKGSEIKSIQAETSNTFIVHQKQSPIQQLTQLHSSNLYNKERCGRCYKEINEEPFYTLCCATLMHKNCYTQAKNRYNFCPSCKK